MHHKVNNLRDFKVRWRTKGASIRRIVLALLLFVALAKYTAPNFNKQVVHAEAVQPHVQETAKVTVEAKQPETPIAAESPQPVETPVVEPVTGSKEDWLSQSGIPTSDWAAVDYINQKESGWCPTKWQGEYSLCPAYHGTPDSPYVGYGLCQSTPGWKMATAGEDWATNPVTQLKWCNSHAQTSHGGWWSSFAYWQVHRNW